MKTHAAAKESGSSASKPFFSASPVQAKCAACEGEEKIQKKSDAGSQGEFAQTSPADVPSDGGADSEPPPNVQAKCSCSEPRIQTRLTLGAPGDRFEQEADRTADTVMRSAEPIGAISPVTAGSLQRDAAETCTFNDEKEKDEEDVESEDQVPGGLKDQEPADTPVSPKRAGGGGSAPRDLEARIDGSRGRGMPMDPATRTFMEARFGYDFSAVQIHDGSQAEGMNRDINSYAFTSGNDIFFAPGQYRPDTQSGRHLLAHELTHVVQQAGAHGNGVVHEKADPRMISRAGKLEDKWYYYYTISGTLVHNQIEKILHGHDSQPGGPDDLVTEAPIPGSNRNEHGLNKYGVADLYKSTPALTVSGIRGLRGLDSLADLQAMKNPGSMGTIPVHVKQSPVLALPIGAKKSDGVPRQLIGEFPSEVQIGEIKPAGAGKLGDGWRQLDNYETGYKEFVKRVDHIRGRTAPSPFSVKRLKVQLPNALNFDHYETESANKYPAANIGADRRLWVAETEDNRGTYLYEDLARSASGKPDQWKSEDRPKLLKLREDLKSTTTKKPGTLGQGKAREDAAVVQRETDRVKWEDDRQKFAKPFRTRLKSSYKAYRDKLRFERKLGKSGKSLPIKQQTEVSEYKQMMFWSGFGGKIFGRIRFLLGDAWDKGVEIFERVKKRLHGLRGQVQNFDSAKVAIGWAARLIKVAIKASKVAFSAFIAESFDFFSQCFQSAMDKMVDDFQKKLLNTELGQKLCQVRKDFLAAKDRLEKEWGGAIEKLQELFALIQNASEWAAIATSVINLIRVGVQVIACLTPPALGCLWGLVVQVGIEAALGIVVGTDWFNQNIITPQVRKLVKKYAAPHYQSLINRVLGDGVLKPYHCNLADQPQFSIDRFEWDETAIKAGTKEMDDHRAEWEKQNEPQMIADLQKVFVKKDGTPVTKENIQELVKQIQAKKLNIGQIKTALDQARDAGSSKIDMDLAAHQVEQGPEAIDKAAVASLGKQRKIDYPKATYSNKALQKMHGWDPTVFYKQPAVKVDSEEFADAVYDLQEAMHIKADGILGDDTLIAFYDRNKLKKDQAYQESVTSRENARRAKERSVSITVLEAKAVKGGKGGGSLDGTVKEVNAEDHTWAGQGLAEIYPGPFELTIQNPSTDEFLKPRGKYGYDFVYKPEHLTLDVMVAGIHEFRVRNVEVNGLFFEDLLIGNHNEWVHLNANFAQGLDLITSKGRLALGKYRWFMSRKPVRDAGTLIVQGKLTLGASGDRFEREADAMADQVVRRKSAGDALPLADDHAPPLQMKCSACEHEQAIQRRVSSGIDGMQVPESVEESLDSTRGDGESMQPHLLEDMESAFGADFSDVRIHNGASAARLSHDLRARAFTRGADIYFNSGEYQPGSAPGRHLLAHELAHVLQQDAGEVRRKGEKDAPAQAKAKDKCTYHAQPGAAFAKPDDHSMGPTGTYYIYGSPYKNEDVRSYTFDAVNNWIRWRFPRLSNEVANRIRNEVATWSLNWTNGQPPAGCQTLFRMSMADMNRLVMLADRDVKSQAAAKQEKDAGLPELADPMEFAAADYEIVVIGKRNSPGNSSEGDVVEKPSPPPAKPDKPKTPRERAEEALDPTVAYNKGKPGSTDPPFPMSMDGPDMEVPNGLGTYTARIEYERVTSDHIMQLAYHMNPVSYTWEIFDINEILMNGLKMGSSMVQEAKRTQSIAQDLEVNEDAKDAADGALRQHGKNSIDQLGDETKDALRELRDPVKAAAGGSAVDIVTRAYANFLNLELLPVSAIVAAGGFLVKAFASLFGDYSREKEIAFPSKPGYYMVRCIATPHPRGPNRSEVRASSVRAKIVEVRAPENLARNALGMPEAAIAQLELQKAMTTDPELRTKFDQQILNIREQTSGDLVKYLERLVKEKEEEKARLPSWRQGVAERELDAIKLRLSQVKDKRQGTGSEHIRPRVAFTSTITGDTYPLLIELSRVPILDDDGNPVPNRHKIRLFDATVPDREKIDREGPTVEQAVDNVFEMFRKNGDLGPGMLMVQMPAGWTGKKEFTLRVSASGGAVVKRRLEDLAMVLMVLSMVVPGVGEVSMAIAAGLAAERLISRGLNGTLRLDAESVGDTLAILGAVAAGAQLIGKLRIATKGDAFIGALRTADSKALELAAAELSTAMKVGKALGVTATVMNAGGLIWGDLVMIKQLADIQTQEMNGTITHAEASRQRASLLTNAIVTHGVMLHGMLKPQGADLAGPETNKAEPPPGENVPPKPPVTDPQGKAPAPKAGEPLPKTGEPSPKAGEPLPKANEPAPKVSPPTEPPAKKTEAPKKEGPPETISEKELEKRAETAPASTSEKSPAQRKDNVRSRFRTPDGLHDIFILEDGRIFRCSLLCSQLRDWYDPYLGRQPEGSRRQRANDLRTQLELLEQKVKAGDKSPEVNDALGRLDVAMREFIAPDLAAELQRGFQATPGAKPGEVFLTEGQVRQLLKYFNIDEIQKISSAEGLKSAQAVRDLAELTAKMDSTLSAADRMALRPVLEKIAEGGQGATTSTEFLGKLSRIHDIPGIKLNVGELVQAFERGDAVLDHGPLQPEHFLEMEIGPFELEGGRLKFGGEEGNMPKKVRNAPWNDAIDFVLIQEGGTTRLVLGREHSGLSGGRTFVFGAGRLLLNKQGFVIGVDRQSGHYRPSVENLQRAVKFLIDKGILLDPAVAKSMGRPMVEVNEAF